jgi:phosphate transport system substrate-binding protein
MWFKRGSSILFVLFSFLATAESEDYIPQPGIDGTIVSVGSDTLANLMTFWAEEFKQYYPNVVFQIQASGSSTAPPALTEGTASVGPMSRELKSSEIAYFSRKYGYEPLALKVGVDAIALFVDVNNPLEGITLEQLDALYSVTRFCGGKKSITHWQQLDASSTIRQSIQLYGRNSVSGTYGSFKKVALCNGDFKATVNEQPGSASVVQSVAYSNHALGYAAFGYKTAGVRSLPIASAGGKYVDVTIDNIASGEYPLSRFLYLVVNKAPGEPLPVLEREFIRFIMSKQGQSLVQRDGYISIPDTLIEAQLDMINE